jgi:hypothetical protein
MLKFAKIWPLLAFVVFLAGCQPVDSLNPLYTDKDVIFDPALLGKWTPEKGGTLEFFQGQTHDYNYAVIVKDDETPGAQMALKGYLINLQGHRFLDLVQAEPTMWEESYGLDIKQTKDGPRVSPEFVHAGSGAYLEFANSDTDHQGEVTLQVRVAHWFFRVTGDDKELHLDSIDDEWLEKLLQQKKTHVTHVLARNQGKGSYELLLTADTAELQKFVVDHVNDEKIFSNKAKFTRGK